MTQRYLETTAARLAVRRRTALRRLEDPLAVHTIPAVVVERLDPEQADREHALQA
jgi:hypothetical protein